MPNRIFINYRRSDTSAEAQNLHLVLSKAFGKNAVFLDVHDIRAGSNWVEVLNQSGSDARVLLVLIGDEWMQADEHGQVRLFDKNDWVRKEIESGLDQKLIAIPVLFNGVQMPAAQNLPVSLQPITVRKCHIDTARQFYR